MRRLFLAAIPIGWLAFSPWAAIAGAEDYEFQAVEANVRQGENLTLAVRLIDRRSGKLMSDAVVFRWRLDMAPDGMQEMTAPVRRKPDDEPGVYAFETNLAMGGRWQLSLAAKVQGEPETVIGKVVIHASE
jgi:hypothetical protein